MSLQNFISKVQADIVLNPKFTGIRARYSRRIEDTEGDSPETKSVILNVSPQGNYVANDGSVNARVIVLWAKTADLKFDGQSFLPAEGDVIEYKMNDVLHRYKVAVVRVERPDSKTTFAYEDGTHQIIKINTIKEI